MNKLSLPYPVRPFHVNQHFGDNLPCVKDFGLPTQKVITGTQTGCPSGYEKLYEKFGMRGHNGTDLQAGEQKIYNVIAGTVIEKQAVPARGLGIGVLSDEQYDFPWGKSYIKIRQWHLKSMEVEVGQHLEVGDGIGIADNTGYSSGDHDHFEGQPMYKDIGGHPYLVNPEGNIAGAMDMEPYFNGEYAEDKSIKNITDTIAKLDKIAETQPPDIQKSFWEVIQELLKRLVALVK